MELRKKIEDIMDKVKNDKHFAEKFAKDPVKAVEDVLGMDLPDEQIHAIADGVKAKLAGGELKDKLSGIFGKKD